MRKIISQKQARQVVVRGYFREELERLQRRRLGENVPPPVVLDVSVRG